MAIAISISRENKNQTAVNKRKLVKWILLALPGLISMHVSRGQVVNIESQRYQTDTTGWAGTLGGNFALTNYGENVFNVHANTHVQYKSVKSLYLFLGGYGFLKGNKQAFVDFGFLHFRYNYKLTKILRLEAFTQLQQNTVTKIQSRFLVGTGPRFKILSTEKIRLYAASLVMYETEKETGNPKQIHNWRSSNYFSLSYLPNSQTELVSTTYYQPVFFDISDSRLMNQTSCKVKAGKKIVISINWNYLFDTTPAAGVVKETYSFSTGIEVDL
jgi:hypothetical protein